MNVSQILKLIQVFGLIVHLLLAGSLIFIGFFDFLGLKPLMNSLVDSIGLFSEQAHSASTYEKINNQISIKILEVIPIFLSVIKSLATMAVLSFFAHIVSFYASWKKDSSLGL